MYKTFKCRECGNDTRYIYRVVGLDNKNGQKKEIRKALCDKCYEKAMRFRCGGSQ